MKLTKLLIGIFCFVILSLSFIFHKGDSIEQYQTFNEYKLEGVPFTNDEKNLYVLIEKKKDTIKVQISNNISKPIFYINKGNYWYSLTSKRIESTELVFAMEYDEKYIYNDTIVHYNYLIHKYGDVLELGSDHIYVETKDRILYLFYDREITKKIQEEDNIDYRFKTLKMLVDNYKDIFICEKYPIIIYPIRYYYSYIKEIKNDTLFLYYSGSPKNPICLEKARLLNSLGEFDPVKGRDIFGNIHSNKKCRKNL